MLNKRQIKLAIRNGSEERLYEQLVTNLIRERYSQNAIEAIINNYLSDMNNEKYKKEFDDMQLFRKECKNNIKALINELKGK